MTATFNKVFENLTKEIDTYSRRYRACLSWYEDADENEKEFCKSFLRNAHFWLNRRNECVRKFNKMKRKTVYEEWTFPY